MYPNYGYPNMPSGSGAGYPHMQQPQPPMLPPPMVPPVVPPAFNQEFERWGQWNSHFQGVAPTDTWRHQAASTLRQTPYDRPVVMQQQVPYGGRPYVPRDLSGPNANTMRSCYGSVASTSRGPTSKWEPTYGRPDLDKTKKDGAAVPLSLNQSSTDVFYNNVAPDLDFDVHVSSTKLDISWKAPHVSGQITYELSIAEGNGFPYSIELPVNHTKYSMRAKAGETYHVSITAKKNANGVVVSRGQRKIKAIFSDAELRLLYDKAVKFTGTRMHPFEILYRCKPKPYWDDIHHNCRNVMERYMKDDNGQPANSINGVISGLFFSARLLPNGTLPTSSPFGNVRMLVQAIMLLDPENVNIYFSDFYCNKTVHYVTIVVAIKGGETDNYASKYLIPLDMRNNPWVKYLIRQDGDKWKFLFYAACNVWVEILYTENVPLSWGRFDQIQATGLGTSKIGGLSNNKACTKCNLYPPGAAAALATETTYAEGDERREDLDEMYRSISPGLIPEDDERVAPPEYEALDSDEEDESEQPAYETGANSTFQTLINCHNVNDYPNWTDLIECVCEVVDGVVMMEKQDRERRITDFTMASDMRVARAIEEMDSVVGACDDDKIHDLAGEVHELAGWWQRARDELSKLCEQREQRMRDSQGAAAAAAVAAAAPPTSGRQRNQSKKQQHADGEDMDEYLEDDSAAKPSKCKDDVITTQSKKTTTPQGRVNLTPSAMRPLAAAAASAATPLKPSFTLAFPRATLPTTPTTVLPSTVSSSLIGPAASGGGSVISSIPMPPSPAVNGVEKKKEQTPSTTGSSSSSRRKKRQQQQRKKAEEEVMDEYLDDEEEVTSTVADEKATVTPPLPDSTTKGTVTAATVPPPVATSTTKVTVVKKEEPEEEEEDMGDLSLLDETGNVSMMVQQGTVAGGSRSEVALQPLRSRAAAAPAAASMSKESIEGEDEYEEEEEEDTVDLKRSITDPTAAGSSSCYDPKRVKVEQPDIIELDEHEEALLLGGSGSNSIIDLTKEEEDELLGL